MGKVYRRPKLYAKQTAAFPGPLIANGNPARYSWIEGSTKSGKTVSCIAWLIEVSRQRGQSPRGKNPHTPLRGDLSRKREKLSGARPTMGTRRAREYADLCARLEYGSVAQR